MNINEIEKMLYAYSLIYSEDINEENMDYSLCFLNKLFYIINEGYKNKTLSKKAIKNLKEMMNMFRNKLVINNILIDGKHILDIYNEYLGLLNITTDDNEILFYIEQLMIRKECTFSKIMELANNYDVVKHEIDEQIFYDYEVFKALTSEDTEFEKNLIKYIYNDQFVSSLYMLYNRYPEIFYNLDILLRVKRILEANMKYEKNFHPIMYKNQSFYKDNKKIYNKFKFKQK